MSSSDNKARRPRGLRRAAAAAVFALGVTVGGSIASPGIASAHGCGHTSHWVWNYDHWDYDSFQYTGYYWNGSRYVHYHNWIRYHPSFTEQFNDCFS